jgi:hypothetical protein
MQRPGLSDAFDGGDFVTIVHHREGQAGIDPLAIDVHRAGAALAVVAAFLRAGQEKVFTQAVEERRARVDAQPMLDAIDAQAQGYDILGRWIRFGRG